jgi:hypothetical protein
MSTRRRCTRCALAAVSIVLGACVVLVMLPLLAVVSVVGRTVLLVALVGAVLVASCRCAVSDTYRERVRSWIEGRTPSPHH